MNTLSIRVILALGIVFTVSGCVVEDYPNRPVHVGYYEHRDYDGRDNNRHNNGYGYRCPPGQHKKHRC